MHCIKNIYMLKIVYNIEKIVCVYELVFDDGAQLTELGNQLGFTNQRAAIIPFESEYSRFLETCVEVDWVSHI